MCCSLSIEYMCIGFKVVECRTFYEPVKQMNNLFLLLLLLLNDCWCHVPMYAASICRLIL